MQLVIIKCYEPGKLLSSCFHYFIWWHNTNCAHHLVCKAVCEIAEKRHCAETQNKYRRRHSEINRDYINYYYKTQTYHCERSGYSVNTH